MDVALLDFPDYMNVGDSMIWAGEVSYLRNSRHRISYVCDINRYSTKVLTSRFPSGPILLNGGGNFGDVWPRFQEFREKVVKDFPDRQIVQLPQSVFFKSPTAAKRANETLGSHKNYTLLVRDHRSLERAREQLPDVKVRFCHDMALGWTPVITKERRTNNRLLVLARQDREAKFFLAEVTKPIRISRDDVADWGLRGLGRALWQFSRIPARIARTVPGCKDSGVLYPLIALGYRSMASLNLHDGVRRFIRASVVVTDRLHAHVLALLLGIPHVVMDNNYDKIQGVLDASTSQFSTVYSENSVDGMLREASALLGNRQLAK